MHKNITFLVLVLLSVASASGSSFSSSSNISPSAGSTTSEGTETSVGIKRERGAEGGDQIPSRRFFTHEFGSLQQRNTPSSTVPTGSSFANPLSGEDQYVKSVIASYGRAQFSSILESRPELFQYDMTYKLAINQVKKGTDRKLEALLMRRFADVFKHLPVIKSTFGDDTTRYYNFLKFYIQNAKVKSREQKDVSPFIPLVKEFVALSKSSQKLADIFKAINWHEVNPILRDLVRSSCLLNGAQNLVDVFIQQGLLTPKSIFRTFGVLGNALLMVQGRDVDMMDFLLKKGCTLNSKALFSDGPTGRKYERTMLTTLWLKASPEMKERLKQEPLAHETLVAAVEEARLYQLADLFEFAQAELQAYNRVLDDLLEKLEEEFI